MSKNLINVAILQLGWWTITLTYKTLLIYSAIVVILLLIHLFFCIENKKKEFIFIIIATSLGCFVDWLAIKLGLFTPNTLYYVFPFWLICYWLVFTTSFSLSLAWLKNRWLLISALGLVMAPLTYYAGEKFDILSFNKSFGYLCYLYYGALWALNYPLLFKIHQSIFSKKATP